MKLLLHLALFVLYSLLIVSPMFGQMTASRDGKLDRSFGEGGLSVMGPFASTFGDSAVLSDGSVISVGSVLANGKFSVRASKHLPDGSPDKSFGPNGSRTYAFATDAFGVSLAVQADGKLLIVGSLVHASNFLVRDFLVLRLTSNGELDSTFSDDGIFTRDFTPSGSSLISNDRASSILVLADGTIIIAGMTDQYQEGQNRTTAYTVLLKLFQTGNVDASFGDEGRSISLVGSNEAADSDVRPVHARLLLDGKILVGVTVRKESSVSPGTYTFHAVAQRFLQNGSLDNSFSVDGAQDVSVEYTPTYPSFFITSAELSSGKFLLLTSDGLVRLNSDGTFDTMFGIEGRASTANNNCYLADLDVMTDTKIVVSKSCTRNLIPTGARYFGRLERYWPDGTIDLRFGRSGSSTLDLGNDDLFFGRVHVFQGKYLIITGTKGLPGMALPFTARFFGTRKL